MATFMKRFEELNKLEIANFSGFGPKEKLLDIADGLRLFYFKKTHPTISPIGLRFSQPITLLQSVFPPAAYVRLSACTSRDEQVLWLTIRSCKSETHRQFRPPARIV